MQSLVILDERLIRFLLMLTERAKSGQPVQEAIRAEAELNLRRALELLDRAKEQQR